jgi:polyisoprenyl-phosphate glycosyltransferase
MNNKKTEISLVIPCYNEAENLESLLELCQKSIAKEPIEVILVDNGSTDNTQKILEEMLPKYPFASTVRVIKNKGYGYGILQGLKAAKSDYIGWTHADLQTNPADVLEALKIIKNNNNSKNLFIKGNRHGRSIFDAFFTASMSIFNTIILRVELFDINAQPTIFHRSFFESWEKPPLDFSLDLYSYYLAKKQKLRIYKIPVYFGKRVAGEAHLKDIRAKIRYSIQSIKYTFSIKNR